MSIDANFQIYLTLFLSDVLHIHHSHQFLGFLFDENIVF